MISRRKREKKNCKMANKQASLLENRNNKGITLVALVITIVVIIILAMITIVFIFGENGLLLKAQEAKKMSEIENTREKLEMATGTAIIDGKGTTTIDDYFEIIENEEIIGNKETDTDDNGDGTYDVVTEDGLIFEVMPVPEKDNADDILIDYKGEATGPRIKNVNATTTTNSATIEVEAENAENAVYKYEYKKEGEDNWQTVEGETGSTCTINNLEENEIYNIRVTVEVASGGNKGTATKEINVRTGEMPTGAITFEEEQWQGDGTASVVVHSSEEGYTIQYQIVETGSITDPDELEEANWKPIENGEQITGIQHNQTAYARLWDGHNGSSYANADVKDTEVPQNATISLSSNNVTTGTTVTATVTHVDNESGVDITKCKYIWNQSSEKLGTDESLYTDGTFKMNKEQISKQINEIGIHYLHVLTIDRAGNKWETVSEAVENTNTAPSAPTVAFSSKTNTSLTVTAKASDAEGDNLSYTLYAGTEQGKLDKVSSPVEVAQNQTATITVSGLTSYTYYYWRVDVSDGRETTRGTEQSRIRTYCYTTKCTKGYTTANGKDCSTCGGDGTISSTSTCTKCGGDKTITSTTTCTSCSGLGSSYCYGTMEYDDYDPATGGSQTRCQLCGSTILKGQGRYKAHYICTECGRTKTITVDNNCRNDLYQQSYSCTGRITCQTCRGIGEVTTTVTCTNCGGTGSITTNKQCTTCGGDGKVTKYTNCIHGYSRTHYWCAHGNDMGVSEHDK